MVNGCRLKKLVGPVVDVDRPEVISMMFAVGVGFVVV
jgi:hypothetical protein